MGWGTGNLGGGSGGLNFKVVGYATETELLADTPKENTIGIITTNKITGWMLDVADPAEPVEGMVYITTGTDSDIAFNALKKNGIMVYPISVKQYVGGAWVDVTVMIYQGGAWVDFIKYILDKNNVYGGWVANGGLTVTQESGGLRAKRTSSYGSCNSVLQFDVNNFESVFLKFSENTGPSPIQLLVHTAKTGLNITPLIEIQSEKVASGIIEAKLTNVKNVGDLYIAFGIHGSENANKPVLIEQIWFK